MEHTHTFNLIGEGIGRIPNVTLTCLPTDRDNYAYVAGDKPLKEIVRRRVNRSYLNHLHVTAVPTN